MLLWGTLTEAESKSWKAIAPLIMPWSDPFGVVLYVQFWASPFRMDNSTRGSEEGYQNDEELMVKIDVALAPHILEKKGFSKTNFVGTI